MTETKTYGIGILVVFPKVWLKVILKEPQLKVTFFVISVSVFSLNARFVSEFILCKDVGDVIVLVGVIAPTVGIKVGVTAAEGKFFVDAGNDTFTSPGIVFTQKAAGLERQPGCG